MANIGLAKTLNVSNTGETQTFDKRVDKYSLKNKGPNTVFVGLNKTTVNTDKSEAPNEIFLEDEDSVILPSEVVTIFVKCAAAETAVLLVVAE